MGLQVATVTGKQVVEAARKYLGVPFKLHGRDKRGIDCIQLVLAVARDFGLVVDDIPDYDLKGLKFKTAERLFLDHGFSPIDPKRVQPGDISFAQNLLTGSATGTSIVSEVGGPSMFCGVSAIVHCETQAYSKPPRMRVVEDHVGDLDSLTVPNGRRGRGDDCKSVEVLSLPVHAELK